MSVMVESCKVLENLQDFYGFTGNIFVWNSYCQFMEILSVSEEEGLSSRSAAINLLPNIFDCLQA